MSYVPSEQIISAPVSIYDIQQALGTYDNDLATLCMKPNINMWSPRKPIYSTKIQQLTNEDWQGSAHADANHKSGGGILKYVGGYDSNYISQAGDVISKVWEYDRPVLDGLCVFRLTDFSGYWHTAARMFSIDSIFGNINHIMIPSNQSEQGVNIGFSMSFHVVTGTLTAQELFGDCWNFYPGVILTAVGVDDYMYIKSAASPISAYASTPASIQINTAEFARQIAADWRASHSGDPYQNFPLRNNDRWTGCLVLLSRQFEGTSGSGHKPNETDQIVRLEYSAGVDRRILPLKQSKYTNIEWMKLRVKITKVYGYSRRYTLQILEVSANVLTTDRMSFTVDATMSVPTGAGTVSIQGHGSGQSSVTVSNYTNFTLSGTTGEVTLDILPSSVTTWDITTSSAGNQLCNGTLTFHNTKGDFQGTFSIDVNQGKGSYEKEITLM